MHRFVDYQFDSSHLLDAYGNVDIVERSRFTKTYLGRLATVIARPSPCSRLYLLHISVAVLILVMLLEHLSVQSYPSNTYGRSLIHRSMYRLRRPHNMLHHYCTVGMAKTERVIIGQTRRTRNETI